jgi:hypothetical protein
MNALKAAIAALPDSQCLPADISLFWDFLAHLDAACPEIWEKRKKGRTVRAARLAWYSEMTGRKITKSEQLFGQELWLMSEWFYNDHFGDYAEWCLDHQEQIRGSVNEN